MNIQTAMTETKDLVRVCFYRDKTANAQKGNAVKAVLGHVEGYVVVCACARSVIRRDNGCHR